MAAIIKREAQDNSIETSHAKENPAANELAAAEDDCGAYTDPEEMARQRRILTQAEGEAFVRSLSEPPGEITPEARLALLNYKHLVAE